MAQPKLFSPLAIRSVSLKNRVVVAPMHQYSAEQGFATDWHLVNAGKYAQGGAGLVIMESTKVARNGCGTVGDTGLWTTSSFRRWRAVRPTSRSMARWPESSSGIRGARRA
jgi:2,4-dienoyl-CoA reductase-like NADH-dependent reductase (Old Yellow Enzyme family)